MTGPNLSTIDLNLLVALDAILREQHVGRAARSVGLSQSAMSHALGRMRRVFDDELFVRSGGKMQPTARAALLSAPLRNCLEQLERTVLHEPIFDASTSSRTFKIATESYFSAVVLPLLSDALRAKGPGIRLEIVRSLEDPAQQLADDGVDLFVGVLDARPRLRRRVLFHDEMACLVRREHPTVRRRPSLKRYASTPHAVVSVGRPGPTKVDRILAEHGLERTVGLRVDNFLAVPLTLASSDLLFTCPARLAAVYAAAQGLRTVPLPIELGTFDYAMVWTPTRDSDPGHRWLRTQLEEVGARV